MHARLLLAGLLGTLLAACAAAGVTRESVPGARGELYLPAGAPHPVPAVVLVHGTAGPDERYAFHRAALLAAGIATFEVDFKTGVFRGPRDRPAAINFVPRAFQALQALRQDARIDPARIAIMGFSLGGQISLLAADQRSSGPLLGGAPGFAAHVGLYPGCRALLARLSADLTDAPLLILTGGEDVYGDATYCPRLKTRLERGAGVRLALEIYPGVQHAFDKHGQAAYRDASALDGRGVRAWDGAAAEDARRRAVAFLRAALHPVTR